MIYNKKPTAKKGIRDGMFTKGSEWELVKDLNGYKTHEEGGVDLTIGKKGVFIHDGQSKYKAANGLLMPGPGDEVAPMSPEQRAALAQQERQSFLTYMQHPSYQARLGREMYGEGYNAEDAKRKQAVDAEYARRVQSIGSVPISEVKAPEGEFYAAYQPEYDKNYSSAIPSGPFGNMNRNKESDIVPHYISVNVDEKYPEMSANPDLYKQVLSHELGHASHLGDLMASNPKFERTKPDALLRNLQDQDKLDLLNMVDPSSSNFSKKRMSKTIENVRRLIGDEKTDAIIDKRNELAAQDRAAQEKYGEKYNPDIHAPKAPIEFNEYGRPFMYEHLRESPSEVATRMIGLRKIAAEKFGHNMNEDFDIKKYGPLLEEYFKKNGMKNEVQEIRQGAYSDDQINRIMKNIAQNTPTSQGTNEKYYG